MSLVKSMYLNTYHNWLPFCSIDLCTTCKTKFDIVAGYSLGLDSFLFIFPIFPCILYLKHGTN